MLEHLLQWDEKLFFFINHANLHWIDHWVPYFRHKIFWAPLYIFILSFFIWNYPRNGLIIILFAVLTVGLSDTISSRWIKKNVERLRPCNDDHLKDEVTLRIRCGGGYSFTSSHATNHAALAFFIFFLFCNHGRRRWRYLLVLWAIAVGLAQIYVGVHYPLDVLGGILVGTAVGWLSAWTFRRYFSLE
ncbi:MAG: phosphatase PAP2 family protein [Saprospiraceae bacterium]|nr:phosphatase PAP2 family protein [Saprospiraceae bacterium]